MEIEAKFRVEDSAVFENLLAIRSLGPYAFEVVPEEEIQQNTYFDTEDGRIRLAHHALRVRTIGNKMIASFKGPTRIVDAVHKRNEWEVEIGGDPSPAFWPPSEARTRALAMVGTERLQPIVQIHTVRHHIRVILNGSPIADLCLDEGTISTEGRRIPFRELEIESAPEASRSEFDALVNRIESEQKLVAEPKSKFARGLELLDNA
jgi:inorganic triphosphatase YgiF